MSTDFSWAGSPGGYVTPPSTAVNFFWLPPDAIFIKRWNGSIWVEGCLKRYSGTTWEFLPAANLQTYGGLAWATPITS